MSARFLIIFITVPYLCKGNLPPVFTTVTDDLTLSESTPIGTVVYTLAGYDPEGAEITFGLISDHFAVDPRSGNITLIKRLDHEEQSKLKLLVSIKDKVDGNDDSTRQDNNVEVPIKVLVLDENDNAPIFLDAPYEADVLENAPVGTTVFNKIKVTDVDTVGENLEIKCHADFENSESCEKFILEVTKSNQNSLTANVILNGTLNYNQRTIYHFLLIANDGIHSSNETFEVRVKDVQNRPPIFFGSLSAVVDEDSPIGTMILKIQARDGDTGEPRKIVYDLLTNPMDYFLLDAKTGELRTAKPLDKESLLDATGLIKLTIRARELVDGTPGSDNLTTAITQASVTLKDVNDSPPTFNKKEYNVSLSENTAPGTPLANLDMNVTDKDVGINSIFALRLNDVSGVFGVEPKLVRSFSQVNIRVENGTLDYENPNHRKFIVLVIAEETNTVQKLSSTATITVSVTDENDNKPVFEHESYTASISESADIGQYITVITAKDMDSGSYGDAGIHYSLSGTGSHLFNVDEKTGMISLANCNLPNNIVERKKRNTVDAVNVTANGESGVLDVEYSTESINAYSIYNGQNDYIENSFSRLSEQPNINNNKKCLDYETENVYFLSYKATDDFGKGQSSVVSLKITVIDANDSPPVCESSLYRASVDEGAQHFESPLVIRARDVDTVSDINYRIIGGDIIHNLFDIDKRSGQIIIRPNASLDVTHLKTDHLLFAVEANDGKFSTSCGINITIRDVNNHAPQFLKKEYVALTNENSEIGTFVEQVLAQDLDSGVNAEIKYRIQQGNFDDFKIDENDGTVVVSRKLDFDRRNTYQIEILASDSGIPSLTGTVTLTVSIKNSNDKDPYFTPSTQRAEVREDTIVGSVVYTLIAIDPDISSFDALEFAATEPITVIDEDGNPITKNVELYGEYFSINRNGKVLLNKPLDRKEFAVIQFTVLVTDSTAPTIQQGKGLLVITILDVNEIPPKFVEPWTPENPRISFQITEEQPIGTNLTALQAYDQESTIGFFNISSNPYFEINQTTGVIKTISRIDYETVKDIKFVATVTDTGLPQMTSTADVTVNVININDNEPHFEQSEYNFNITENSPQGTVVGKVEAKDGDLGVFGEITYSLLGENSKSFLIDSFTGSIVVSNSSILDHEKISKITLTVMAVDKAPIPIQKSAMATIYINVLDVNDNHPIFTQEEYSSKVAENAALNPPAALLQVKAEDIDDGIFGEIRYFIVSGNEDDLFKLDTQSGIIYPSQSLQGRKGTYTLTIEARDNLGSGHQTSLTTVTIEVHDVNQHRPHFIVPVQSNATIELTGDIIESDHLIITIKAFDNDTGDNGKISYHLQINNQNVQETDDFIIGSANGELKTKKQLRRKENGKYELILVAQDNGSPSKFEALRFLTINLVDGSENRPEFPDSLNPYKISINENSGRDVRIGKVQALYKNKNLKDIFYYMILGNEDGAFYLDKTSGDIYTNKSLDRETTDFYTLYILASNKQDLHISEAERASFTIKSLERDVSVAKVDVTILDVNDNDPVFEKSTYYAGINAKSTINGFVTEVNATDKDFGENAKIEYLIITSNLYKLGSTKSTGSIVPSPFAISIDGRITTATFVAEYNQDRFELEVVAKETQPPERHAKAKVYVWIYDSSQLIRVILSRPPFEVQKEQEEIILELKNATNHRIIVDEIRYHVDSTGRIRMDWCDMFFHAVDRKTQQIVPVDDILKTIDASYDYLRDYYAGFAIENVVPAHVTTVQEEFDLALAGLAALIIVLFVGVVSFIVLCLCLKHWNLTVPMEKKRKETLIKKQIIEDLNTTENPLWIEQKLKLYEEQELTMQVFSEPEQVSPSETIPALMERKDSFENLHPVDNTYATIQPRNDSQTNEMADYATLRNNRVPSTYEFTGSTFQVPIREDDAVAELI